MTRFPPVALALGKAPALAAGGKICFCTEPNKSALVYRLDKNSDYPLLNHLSRALGTWLEAIVHTPVPERWHGLIDRLKAEEGQEEKDRPGVKSEHTGTE